MKNTATNQIAALETILAKLKEFDSIAHQLPITGDVLDLLDSSAECIQLVHETINDLEF